MEFMDAVEPLGMNEWWLNYFLEVYRQTMGSKTATLHCCYIQKLYGGWVAHVIFLGGDMTLA